jgi:hypothetical protein
MRTLAVAVPHLFSTVTSIMIVDLLLSAETALAS